MSQFRIDETVETHITGESTAKQFIGMRLGVEEYVMDISSVREILMLDNITYVPRVADHFEGVINLRGKIIPIINLRMKLGLEDADFTQTTRVIIVDVEGNIAGLLVDAVTKVLRISDENLEPASSSLGEISEEYICGVGRTGGGIVGLLDVEKLIG
ncbi:MAG: chemotaxis protein CheW [Nitrospinota bacterium]